MPAILEHHSETSPSDLSGRDSTFTYDPATPAEQAADPDMDRLREARSSEHLRTESVDSGIETPNLLSPGAPLQMKRTSSGNVQHRSSYSAISINEQTQLLLQKMLILEKKLQSMESQLKNEQVQRLSLEAKVVRLERDNEQLKSTRAQAGLQLQNFAEIFYSETETIKLAGSCNTSPHPSLAELRHRSRTDSLSSSSSLHSRGSRGSRLSGASM